MTGHPGARVCVLYNTEHSVCLVNAKPCSRPSISSYFEPSPFSDWSFAVHSLNVARFSDIK